MASDEFGGQELPDSNRDEYGGVAIEEAPPSPQFPRLQPGETLPEMLRQPTPLFAPNTGPIALGPSGLAKPPDFIPAKLPSTDLSPLLSSGGAERQLSEAATKEYTPPLQLPEAPGIDKVPQTFGERIVTGPIKQALGQKASDVQAQIQRELYNSAKSIPEFMSTEEGMLGMLASLTPLGRAGVTGYFAKDMVNNWLEEAKGLGSDWDSLDSVGKAKRLTKAAANLGLAAILTRAGIKEARGLTKPLFPKDLTPPAQVGMPAPEITGAEKIARPGEYTPRAPLPTAPGTIPRVTPVPYAGQMAPPAQRDLSSQAQIDALMKEGPAPSTAEVPGEAERTAPAPSTADVPTSAPPPADRYLTQQESHPIDSFESALKSDKFDRVDAKKQSFTAGMATSTTADLERFLKMREDLSPTTPAEKMDMSRVLKAQLAREAFEVATDTGSQTEVAKKDFERLGARPMDWKTNPEVNAWFQKNAARLEKAGFKVPEGLLSQAYDYSPADLKTYQDLNAKLAATPDELVNKPEYNAVSEQLATLQRKYAGQKPKQLTAQAAAETAAAPAPKQRLTLAQIRGRIAAGEPLGAEAGFVTVPQWVTDAVSKSADYVKDLAKEELNAPKMTDRRKAVLNWSAKLQRSFGEAAAKQRAIMQSVPKAIRREGITNWIQADGDKTVLRDRVNSTSDPKLKAGYEAALTLTPDEIAIANQVKADYADFAKRGQAADVLGDLKDNYVTQTWNLGRGAGTGGPGSGRMLKEKFKFSKASTFQNFFEGEQAGYKPKTKDIAKLLPMYSHEMNSVIAAREMVSEMGSGKASDGRPLLAPKGVGIPVDSADGGKATLVLPKVGQEDIKDYKVLPNQPALSKWKWVSKDDSGNPVFLKADLALHPEAFNHLKNILGRSAIRDWYGTKSTALGEVPKLLVKGIDIANSETKRTMLGLLATFHQIQTGTHAIGHRVNPLFSIPKIDLVNNKLQMDAAQHGLMMLPDRTSMDQFMEGFRTSGIISKIPGIGPMADWYSNYLFHDYIPGLKFKTYDAILKRNMGVYDKPLKAGKVTEADVKVLSAEQANAAYGHINYSDLARNPTIQHIAQLGLLAPDFLEARGRFAGQAIKGLTGAKVGREQLVALATLAIAQATGAYVSAKLTDGEWDAKRPFEFVKGNRRYTLRSVPEDVQNLVTHTRQFIHSRLSPLIGKGGVQYLTGVDYRGRKISAANTTKELAAQPLPLSIRGFTGLGNSTLSGMEQLAGALGLRISRYSPMMDMHDMIVDFKKGSDDPKLKADVELQEQEVFASPYEKLRSALHNGDLKSARKEYDKISATRTPEQIDRAMKPWTGGTVNRTTLAVSPRKPKPFTGSAAAEAKFVKQLTPDQKKTYQKALAERTAFYDTFQQMLKQPSTKSVDEYGGVEVE